MKDNLETSLASIVKQMKKAGFSFPLRSKINYADFKKPSLELCFALIHSFFYSDFWSNHDIKAQSSIFDQLATLIRGILKEQYQTPVFLNQLSEETQKICTDWICRLNIKRPNPEKKAFYSQVLHFLNSVDLFVLPSPVIKEEDFKVFLNRGENLCKAQTEKTRDAVLASTKLCPDIVTLVTDYATNPDFSDYLLASFTSLKSFLPMPFEGRMQVLLTKIAQQSNRTPLFAQMMQCCKINEESPLAKVVLTLQPTNIHKDIIELFLEFNPKFINEPAFPHFTLLQDRFLVSDEEGYDFLRKAGATLPLTTLSLVKEKLVVMFVEHNQLFMKGIDDYLSDNKGQAELTQQVQEVLLAIINRSHLPFGEHTFACLQYLKNKAGVAYPQGMLRTIFLYPINKPHYHTCISIFVTDHHENPNLIKVLQSALLVAIALKLGKGIYDHLRYNGANMSENHIDCTLNTIILLGEEHTLSYIEDYIRDNQDKPHLGTSLQRGLIAAFSCGKEERYEPFVYSHLRKKGATLAEDALQQLHSIPFAQRDICLEEYLHDHANNDNLPARLQEAFKKAVNDNDIPSYQLLRSKGLVHTEDALAKILATSNFNFQIQVLKDYFKDQGTNKAPFALMQSHINGMPPSTNKFELQFLKLSLLHPSIDWNNRSRVRSWSFGRIVLSPKEYTSRMATIDPKKYWSICNANSTEELYKALQKHRVGFWGKTTGYGLFSRSVCKPKPIEGVLNKENLNVSNCYSRPRLAG